MRVFARRERSKAVANAALSAAMRRYNNGLLTPRHQMLNDNPPPLQTSGARLASPAIGALMTDTLMTSAWRAAHRRLDRILKVFFIIDVFGTFIGVVYHDAWFTIVCLVGAFSAGMIAMSKRESVFVSPTEDDEFTNEKELIEAYVFAREFAEASNLLAATMLAIGFVIGNPWWSNLLVAVSAWLIGLFGLPLLCAARNNRACDADGDASGSVKITASDDGLATPTGLAL